MSQTTYVEFGADFAADFAHEGQVATWRCGICRRAESRDDDVEHRITVCEHIARGGDTYEIDKQEPRVGAVGIAYVAGPVGAGPAAAASWVCDVDECGEVALCSDCWSNL